MKRIKASQVIRHIIQLATFVFMPGLFILTLNAISSIYQSILSGTFSVSGQAIPLVILLAVIPITVLWGRFFCGYLCAFGSMTELLNYVARKLKIPQLKTPDRLDKVLKYLKYAVLILLVAAWTLKISLNTFSPWYVFGVYSSYKGWTNIAPLISIGGILLLLIMAGSLFVDRFFCRYFCPLGGVFTVISLPRIFKIKKQSKLCTGCNVCTRKCPMGIDVNRDTSKHEKVKSGECIDCFRCSSACGEKALSSNPAKIAAGPLAALTVAGVYYAGTITVNTLQSQNVSISEERVSESSETTGKYKDGTYTGTGKGYLGDTTVTVTVENGNISSINVDSYVDDQEFFVRAQNSVVRDIISSQSTDVSVVSGATFSSLSIISAVENALDIQENTEDTTDSTEISGQTVISQTEQEEAVSDESSDTENSEESSS